MKLSHIITLRDMATAMGTMKKAQAEITDGVIIGITSKTGGPYTADLPSIGSVFFINGKYKLAVDAIVYDKHVGDSGKVYEGENRLILVEFNPDTLLFTGDRTNVGFKSVNKADHVGTIWAFIKKFDDNAAAARRKELLAEQARQRAIELANQKAREEARIAASQQRQRLAKSREQLDILNLFC